MEGGPSTAQFEHDTIPGGGRHIRLLEIQEINPDGHVVCRLTTWPVAGAPAYYALSYVFRMYIDYLLRTDGSLVASDIHGAHQSQLIGFSSTHSNFRQVKIAFTR